MKEKFPTSFVIVIVILLLLIVGFYYWASSGTKEHIAESDEAVDSPTTQLEEENPFQSQVQGSSEVHKPPKGWSIDGKGGGSMTPGPKGPVPGQKNK
ncbi:MAG: hypothetical protein IJS60_07820 [Abditibacteriota bacterium]|nr:hypothetical protein [Abditibacteriota bacterium]